ncbi:class I SAM-dependent methyltransferase [Planctomycetota bacterium]
MTLADYVKKISFWLVQPREPVSDIHKLSRWVKVLKTSDEFAGWFDEFYTHFDLLNTRLPKDQLEMFTRMKDLCRIPRLSTFAVGAIINEVVSRLGKDCSYVNVGVWHGFSFLSGMKGNEDKTCIGIDNFSEFHAPRRQFMKRFRRHRSAQHHFHYMDYRDYFSGKHEGRIGFYFYDGEHSYHNQLEGLQIAEPFFSRNCVVMVDDTNWAAPRKATMDFIRKSEYAYEILLDRKTAFNFHPTFWNGIMLLRKKGKKR